MLCLMGCKRKYSQLYLEPQTFMILLSVTNGGCTVDNIL